MGYPHYAVLNALAILLAIVGAAIQGGGVWVFVLLGAVFSARGRTKRPNSPAAACALLIPILLINMEDAPLYLFWTAFVLIAMIPFRYTTNSTDPLDADEWYTDIQQERKLVSLWTVWEDDTHTRLNSGQIDSREGDGIGLLTPGVLNSGVEGKNGSAL